MESQATEFAAAGSNADKVIAYLLRSTTKEQLRTLIEAAAASSGQTVGGIAFEPGDEICPTFKFPFPFPPKFEQFLIKATELGAVRLFPYGTPHPLEVLVQTRPPRVR
jgi:hypothetical protein